MQDVLVDVSYYYFYLFSRLIKFPLVTHWWVATYSLRIAALDKKAIFEIYITKQSFTGCTNNDFNKFQMLLFNAYFRNLRISIIDFLYVMQIIFYLKSCNITIFFQQIILITYFRIPIVQRLRKVPPATHSLKTAAQEK